MKLLFLTPQLPFPPHQGTTLRNFNLIKQLAPRHEIHLLSIGAPAELTDSPLNGMCARIELMPPPTRGMPRRAVETLSQPLPDMARRLYTSKFAERLTALLQETRFDVLQIEGIEMASYWLGAAAQALPKSERPRVVFDDHNAEWALQRTAYDTDRHNPRRWHAALYSRIQYQKLREFERAVCLAADAVVAVSEQDSHEIAALDPHIQPRVIPNGVDVEYYVPSAEVCAKPLAELALVFTGKMDFRPNIDAALWFADEILPRVRQQIPLAHISFVGQKPSPRVRALAERPGVEVTGWVADTRPYIADAAVFVVPLRMGSGTRLKVLEAMAMGKPIVSTSFGVAGIECADGREALIGDTPDAMAEAIVTLLRDRTRAQALGAAARELAVTRYDWRKLVPKFEAIYEGSAE